MRDLTKAELAAVSRLKQAVRDFPATLRLQAGTGGLNVVVLDPKALEPYYIPGTDCWDSASIVATLGVDAEGGDPW